MELLSLLIGQIYDTIINPESWPSVLAAITDYLDAARGILILEDAIDTVKSAFYVSFDDPEWLALYLNTYLLLNPMRLATFGQVEAGAVILTSDLMTPQEYTDSRFAREFLSLREMVDVAVMVLEATATTITVVAFARSREQGFADEQVRQKLTLIGPHIRRAASIGRVLNRHKIEAATLADTLDSLDGAIFLLDGKAFILHSNLAARALLATQSHAVAIHGGRLWPVGSEPRALLTDALTRAAAGDAALGADGVSLVFGSTSDSAGDLTLVGSVVSLVDGARREMGAPYRAVAAVVIRALRFDTPVTANVLGSLYRLTPREIAVAASIVEFGGVPRTAAILGLKGETVRTHLKSVFRKTGTRRQADLVKLLASIASPFRPPN